MIDTPFVPVGAFFYMYQYKLCSVEMDFEKVKSRARDMYSRMPRMPRMPRFGKIELSAERKTLLFILPVILIVVTIVLVCVFATLLDKKVTPIKVPYWVATLVLGMTASASSLICAMLINKKPCDKTPSPIEKYSPIDESIDTTFA